MFAVIGLGNPGSEYENTRHNTGFSVVNTIADKFRIGLTSRKEDYIFGAKEIKGTSLLLVKPLLYMNNSGIVVKDVLKEFAIGLNQILVVLDDFSLPLGTIRIRERGSSGGHNGLYSIIYNLQSEDFPRLRCGISGQWMPTSKDLMADFVLSPFMADEVKTTKKMIRTAGEAAVVAATENIQNAINRFNKKIN